jgi:hypothetical protein
MRVALSPLAGVQVFSAGAGHAAGMDPDIMQRFQELSLPVPTLTRVVACHGFACKYRSEIGFDDTDHAVLKKMMAKAGATPEPNARPRRRRSPGSGGASRRKQARPGPRRALAVLSDLRTGVKWAVDSWVSDNGQLPDVRPLSEWQKGDCPCLRA